MKIPPPPLVIIVGPTGSGKTGVVHALAETLPGPIISADSMQVYRYMDIGTAKPTLTERGKLSYHLIDVVNPDEVFNASMFLEMSQDVLDQKTMAGEPVYIAGGTGLYVRILLGGLIAGPGPDEVLRKQYKDLATEFGKAHLYDLLKERDQQAADRINPNDTVRVIRALEVHDLTGESIIKKQEAHAFQENRDYRYIKIGVRREKEQLQQRIEKRVDQMMDQGLLREVEQLLAMNYGSELKSMQSLGYRHMVRYVRGEWSLDEAVSAMKRETWQYAKRQMTWFKKDGEILWFDPEDLAGMRSFVASFLCENEGKG
jgi:tRNA dimethylallyltransferase